MSQPTGFSAKERMPMQKKKAVAYAEAFDALLPGLVRSARNLEYRRISRFSLTLPQFFALAVLEEGPLMMKELAEELGLALGTVTGIVDRLHRSGLVERFRDDRDRRVVRARLTEKGEEVMREIHRDRVRNLSLRLQGMEEGDIEALVKLLAKYGMALAADGGGAARESDGGEP